MTARIASSFASGWPSQSTQFTRDAQGRATAEGLRGVPRESLVGDVGVVLELTGWFNEIDAPVPRLQQVQRPYTAASSVAVK